MSFANRICAIGLLAALWLQPALASHVLKAEHRRVLDGWLKQHPNLRLAALDDCEGCRDDIEQTRRGSGGPWRPVPDYHPYRAVGDFNGDGRQDFAVVLVDTSKRDKVFVLVVFNGPFRDIAKPPAFLETGMDLRHGGLFSGPPRPKPYRLLVGPFESDAGGVLKPRNGSYRWSDDER